MKRFFLMFLFPLSCFGQVYTTTFALTENPIAENGKWQVPGSVASQWGNVETSGGLAYGVNIPVNYGDPTAILTGTWSPDQQASATIKIVNGQSGCCHEVEVRLRYTISSNNIAGYEIDCSIVSSPAYLVIVRWNGPSGNFSYLNNSNQTDYCKNGDVLSADVSGTNPVTIHAYINGVLKVTATDTGSGGGPWTSGNPGIGFDDTSPSNLSNYGFSSFTVSAPPPPTVLKALVAAQYQEIFLRHEQLLTQREQLLSRDAQIQHPKLLIAKLRRMQFWFKSEKPKRRIEQVEDRAIEARLRDAGERPGTLQSDSVP